MHSGLVGTIVMFSLTQRWAAVALFVAIVCLPVIAGTARVSRARSASAYSQPAVSQLVFPAAEVVPGGLWMLRLTF